MNITPLGAAGEVTGSAYLVESNAAKVLIDCGMFQGGKKQDAKNRPPRQQLIKHRDAVLITHAHLDHTGRLPLLVQRDFSSPIYATPATIELSDIVLQDAARIQQADAERVNRKNQRAGLPRIEPLYTPEEVKRALQLFRPAPHDESFEVAPGMSARLVEAGHLLGSVSIELNELPGPFMIIAGSGMCTAGRILHHLRHNLWRPETAVLFVGYQAEGSLGRRLVEGADEVKIFGEPVAVKARIATVNGFSGHAGQGELVEWFDALAGSRPRVAITHGEDKSRKALAKVINARFRLRPVLPAEGQTLELN